MTTRSLSLLAICWAVAVIVLPPAAVGASAGEVRLFKDESAIADVNSGPARAAAQALADERLLTADRVEAFLRGVAAWREDIEAWQVYLTYSDMVVPYLRARQPAILEALRLFASGAVKGKALVALLQAAAKKLTHKDFMQWISDTSTPSPSNLMWKFSPQQLHKATAAAVPPERARDGRALAAAAGLDLRDPKVQIVEFAARLKTFNQTLGFKSVNSKQARREPRVPSKRANLNIGRQSFQARKIGIVIHAFQFQDEFGYLHPPGAYLNGVGRARNLVDNVNKIYRYSGTNIQFYVKQYRSDTKKYPYLNLKTLEAYQKCAKDDVDCTCAYAKKYSLESSRFINIFVVGAPYQYKAYGSPNVYVEAAGSVIPPYADACNSTSGNYTQGSSRASQHILTLWENFDTLNFNSCKWSQKGASNVAHEIGHLLGLFHTFFDGYGDENNCITSNDGIFDTPMDLNQYFRGENYTIAAGTLCVRMAKQGKVTAKDLAAMDQFDSCPKQRYMDNLFNIMAYPPSPFCSLYFTRGQIARMQWVLSKSQSRLGK